MAYCKNIVSMIKDDMEIGCIITESLNIAEITCLPI